MLTKEEIEETIENHLKAPHLRELQKLLAKEVTVMVHGYEEYEKALDASQILFGNSTYEKLKNIDEQTFLSVFEGVPQFEISRTRLPLNIVELLSIHCNIFSSKGECRKMIQAGGLSINKERCETTDLQITENELLNNKYILVQKGKKNYFIIKLL